MKAGQTIKNNHTGETLTMLASEEETRGERQLYQVCLPPRRPSPPPHYHLAFSETFCVIEGALDLYLGKARKHVLVHPGESITAEIGQVHTFANERDQTAMITIESKPAGGVVRAFQLAYGVANEGAAAKDGLPRSLLVRLLFIRMIGGFLPEVPLVLQKLVFGVAAFLARLTAVQKRLARYYE